LALDYLATSFITMVCIVASEFIVVAVNFINVVVVIHGFLPFIAATLLILVHPLVISHQLFIANPLVIAIKTVIDPFPSGLSLVIAYSCFFPTFKGTSQTTRTSSIHSV